MNAMRVPDGSQGYSIQSWALEKEERSLSPPVNIDANASPPSMATSQISPRQEEIKMEQAYVRSKVESLLDEKADDDAGEVVRFIKGIDPSVKEPLFDQQNSKSACFFWPVGAKSI